MTIKLTSPAVRLQQLAHRIERLDLRRVDPEAYHAEKSEIASAVRQLSRELGDAAGVEPSTTFHRTAADADARLRRRPANDNFFKAA